jgi:rhamnose transport system permease protein
VIYVAHLGQAKSDAGTGYELMAIAAVVLGGTSIFGGRGTIHGTVFGPAGDRCTAKRAASLSASD